MALMVALVGAISAAAHWYPRHANPSALELQATPSAVALQSAPSLRAGETITVLAAKPSTKHSPEWQDGHTAGWENGWKVGLSPRS